MRYSIWFRESYSFPLCYIGLGRLKKSDIRRFLFKRPSLKAFCSISSKSTGHLWWRPAVHVSPYVASAFIWCV